jgi:hypothetical protein
MRPLVKSYRTIAFKRLFAALPPDVKIAARKAYQLWLADPKHPSLHFKPIRSDIWSIRISLDYRALGVLRGGDIYWHWIGRHDEYQKRIRGS